MALVTAFKPDSSNAMLHKVRWATHIHFLYVSALADANKAARISESTSSHRQAIHCLIFQQRVAFAKAQFDYQMCLSGEGGLTTEIRGTFENLVAQKLMDLERDADHICRIYVNAAHTEKGRDDARQWLEENWTGPKAAIIDDWDSLKRAIHGGVFYTPVTRQEQMAIVQALGFGTFLNP